MDHQYCLTSLCFPTAASDLSLIGTMLQIVSANAVMKSTGGGTSRLHQQRNYHVVDEVIVIVNVIVNNRCCL